jgi:N-acyl-D-amino-acid deacylase
MRMMRVRVGALVVAAAMAMACAGVSEFDLIIRGGMVYDGLDQAPRRIDVGIKGDRITALGDLSTRRAGEVIVATDRVVAPGFIDANSPSSASLLADGDADSYVRQGITTVVLTDLLPAVASPAADRQVLQAFGIPFDWQDAAGYLARLEQRGTSVNVASLAPAAALPADGADAALNAAMTAGAFGLVAAPIVTDAPNGDDARLAATVKRTNGVYVARWAPGVPEEGAVTALAGVMRAAQLASAALIAAPRSANDLAPDALRRAISEQLQQGLSINAIVNPYPADDSDVAQSEVVNLLSLSGAMIGTFAPAVRATGVLAARAHPAAFGAFPRVVGRYVRETKRPANGAIYQATGLPASAFRLDRRGFVRERYYADLVVFDPNTLADQGTAENPSAYPAGIDYVVVNGVVTVRPGRHTGARAGRGLTGPAARRPTGS